MMSEARALTNFAGNSIATVLIGHWVGELDRPRLDRSSPVTCRSTRRA